MRTGRAHLRVGLDCNDAIPIREKHVGEHSCAGADVRDEPLRRQSAPVAQRRKDLVGVVTFAIEIVVGCPAVKPLNSVRHVTRIGHARSCSLGACYSGRNGSFFAERLLAAPAQHAAFALRYRQPLSRECRSVGAVPRCGARQSGRHQALLSCSSYMCVSGPTRGCRC